MTTAVGQDEREPLPGERIYVRVSFLPAVAARMAALAKRQDVSVQAFVRRAVRELISEAGEP